MGVPTPPQESSHDMATARGSGNCCTMQKTGEAIGRAERGWKHSACKQRSEAREPRGCKISASACGPTATALNGAWRTVLVHYKARYRIHTEYSVQNMYSVFWTEPRILLVPRLFPSLANMLPLVFSTQLIAQIL